MNKCTSAIANIGSWSEQATWCAKAYKWNKREHCCCSIYHIPRCHILGTELAVWCLHPFGAETRKSPPLLGLSTPHHSTDTCCNIQGCGWVILGPAAPLFQTIPDGLGFH